MKKASFFLCLLLAPFIFPSYASAHAFGVQYNLPLPAWLYIYGGAGVLILSFILIGYFINKHDSYTKYPTLNFSKTPLSTFLTSPILHVLLKILSVLLYLFTIYAGFVGSNDATANINMTIFWVIFLLGLTYFTAIFGNIWNSINPIKIIFEAIEKVVNTEIKGLLVYPKWLGVYPAFILYLALIWTELFATNTPRLLSLLMLLYFFINFLGVLLLGTKNWFEKGELFSVFFRFVGKISIIESKNGKLNLRPPFVGLLNGKAENLSELIFIIFMLSSTAFDGFRSTKIWYDLTWGAPSLTLHQVFGNQAGNVLNNTGLIGMLVLFFLLYLLFIFLSKIVVKSKLSVMELAKTFAFSLIPIAVVYNAAHYYTLLLTQGQDVFRLISDPFGKGWNIFGTSQYAINLSIIDANFTWHAQVALIVIGHIAGVYIAHLIALRVFKNPKSAIINQIPILVLMVIYTMVGLWILSQPIVNG